MKERIKIFSIRQESLCALFGGKRYMIIGGIPPTARVLQVAYDFPTRCLHVLVADDSFDEIEPYEVPPIVPGVLMFVPGPLVSEVRS